MLLFVKLDYYYQSHNLTWVLIPVGTVQVLMDGVGALRYMRHCGSAMISMAIGRLSFLSVTQLTTSQRRGMRYGPAQAELILPAVSSFKPLHLVSHQFRSVIVAGERR